MPVPVRERRSPPDAIVLGAWVAWCALVATRYFTIPPELIAWREPGELLPPPFAREAFARLLSGVAAAAVVTLSAWAVGALLLRRGRSLFASGLERVVFELALGFGAFSFACLLLASGGLYRPGVVAVVAGGLTLAGLAQLPGRIRGFSWSLFAKLSWSELAAIAVGVAASGCALTGALAPETEYDALWYHLWLPSRWLAAGHPVDVVTEYVSLYPLTWELLFGVAMALGGDTAAKLLHFECFVLAGVTTAVFSSRWFPGTRGLVSGVLAVTVPLMIWEGTTAYIDLALAWYVVSSAHALARHDETRDRRWLLLAALTMGIALAIKNLGLVCLAIAAVILVVRELQRRSPAAVLRVAALFVFVAMLVPAPWYTRAWIRSGNPVFPDLYPVFGARPPGRWDADTERELRRFKARFGRSRTVAHMLALPWDVTMHGARYGGTIGPVFLLLVPVAILAAVSDRARRARVTVLAAAIAAYGVVWALPISSFQLRFIVPVIPLMATLAGEGLRRLPSTAGIITTVLLVLNLPPFTEWHEADRGGWEGWLTHTMRLMPLPVIVGAESGSAYIARKVPSVPAWNYIDTFSPAGSRVLTFTGGDHLYSRTNRVWSNTPIARPATWGSKAGAEREAHAAMLTLGVTHVLIDRRDFQDPNFRALAIASAGMRACCLEQVYDDGRFVVYRVR